MTAMTFWRSDIVWSLLASARLICTLISLSLLSALTRLTILMIAPAVAIPRAVSTAQLLIEKKVLPETFEDALAWAPGMLLSNPDTLYFSWLDEFSSLDDFALDLSLSFLDLSVWLSFDARAFTLSVLFFWLKSWLFSRSKVCPGFTSIALVTHNNAMLHNAIFTYFLYFLYIF